MPKKILVADDEERIRRIIHDFLVREKYEIEEACDGREAIELFNENNFDLVILDVMMPEYDGWSVCREIRKTSSVPIIMLTARSEEFDQLFGFEMGADEYITKPFSPKILVARINALFKRIEKPEEKMLDFNGLVVDITARKIYVNNVYIDLSPTEYELLIFMIENKGIALSREQLLSRIWGYEYNGTDRTLDTHINRLRIKLEEKEIIFRL